MQVLYRERWLSSEKLWMAAVFSPSLKTFYGVSLMNSAGTFIPASDLKIPDTFKPGVINDQAIYSIDDLRGCIRDASGCIEGQNNVFALGPPPTRASFLSKKHDHAYRAWMQRISERFAVKP